MPSDWFRLRAGGSLQGRLSEHVFLTPQAVAAQAQRLSKDDDWRWPADASTIVRTTRAADSITVSVSSKKPDDEEQVKEEKTKERKEEAVVEERQEEKKKEEVESEPTTDPPANRPATTETAAGRPAAAAAPTNLVQNSLIYALDDDN